MEFRCKQTLWQWLPWSIILLGIIVRLHQYEFNRSLWLDEAFIATVVVNASFIELFQQPLEYSHFVPPGFLVMAKLSIVLLGNSDFILRLFPFLCSIAALGLFYQLAKIYITKSAIPLALLLFALADVHIYYSSEFKQYASDVAITLALLLLPAYLQANPTRKRFIVLALSGIIAPWFSHPTIFILATIGSYLLFFYLYHKQFKTFSYLTVCCLIWFASLLISYYGVIGGRMESVLPTSKHLLEFWHSENAFMPHRFSAGWQWLVQHYFSMFTYPGSLDMQQLGGWLFIVACIALMIERKRTLFLLTVPILITLFAAFLQKYPFATNHLFSGRLILFLIPCFYLLIAEGVVRIQVKLSNNTVNYTLNQSIQAILAIFLFSSPLFTTVQRWREPHAIEEIKPVLAYVQQYQQPNDTFYIYHWAEPAFRYYASFYNFDYNNCHLINQIAVKDSLKEVDYFRRHMQPVKAEETRCILGVAEAFGESQVDIEKLRGRGRVWFIFSHNGEMPIFNNYLNSIGVKIREFPQPGAIAYLYQL